MSLLRCKDATFSGHTHVHHTFNYILLVSTCTPKFIYTPPLSLHNHFISPLSYIVTSSKLHPDFQLTPFTFVLSLSCVCEDGHKVTGAGDEEGPVSWGRELILQGAGKSWVGVLPSSDLGLVEGEGESPMFSWTRGQDWNTWWYYCFDAAAGAADITAQLSW